MTICTWLKGVCVCVFCILLDQVMMQKIHIYDTHHLKEW